MKPPWEERLQGAAERKLWSNLLQQEPLEAKSREWAEIGPCDSGAGSSWGADRSIRASIIAAIAMGEANYKPPVLRVRGARITGELYMEAAHVVCPILFDCCYFDGPINLEQVEASGIYLTKCNVPGGMRCSQLHTRHNLYLEGCTFGAKVNISSARVDGQLSMEGTHLNREAPLLADSITVRQGAYFSKLRAEGGVRLKGAQITKKFDMTGAKLTASDGEALSAPRMQVFGNLLLSNDFHARGTVDLTNTIITGYLDCKGGRFNKAPIGDSQERCLDLARVDVRQHVYLNSGFSASGTVYLADAVIGGTLDCKGGTFTNPTDTCIYAPGIKVGRAVLFTKSTTEPDLDQSGFSARGKVILAGAKINAKLDCTGGRFLTEDGRQTTLDVKGATVGSVIFGPAFQSQGVVDLRQTSVKGELVGVALVDPTKIRLSRLSYNSVRDVAGGDAADTADVGQMVRWLKRVNYSSQVYLKLASTYAAEGNEEAAKRVLIAGREARRRGRKGSERYKRFTELPLKWLVNYGYSPLLVLIWLGLLEGLGAGLFYALSDDMALVPIYKGSSVKGDGQPISSWHPEFHPWIYTADLLLPVVDLHQSRFWIPTHAAEWIAAALTVAGWVLATALVVGLGSVFRSDNRRKEDGASVR